MKEKKILNNRWREIDDFLSSYLDNYKKLNRRTRRKIQEVFDSIDFTIEEINDYASNKRMNEFKDKIEEFLENNEVEGYVAYQLRKLLNRKKIRNNEVVENSILMAYQEESIKLDEMEKTLFQTVSETIYRDAQREAIEVLGKPKDNKVYPLPDFLLLGYLALPTYRGYKWKDYRLADIEYNVRQIYTQLVMNMQQNKRLDVNNDEFKSIFNKQNNRYLNKKKDSRQADQYSGALDNEVCFLANQIALDGMIKQGCTRVQFIAVVDEKTTAMCETLNGQIFNINDWNTFSRYSATDGKNVVYKIKGLQVGVNLPPIDNHFHYCRSTIYPVRN